MSNRLIYLQDVTIEDGTPVKQGEIIGDKTWLVRNGGQDSWKKNFVLKHTSGPDFGGPEAIPLPPLKPGEEGQITIPGLTAPRATGKQVSSWLPFDSAGNSFQSNLTIVIDVKSNKPLAPTVVTANGLLELPLSNTSVTFGFLAEYTGNLFNVTSDHLHHGVDLAAVVGTPVFASAEGTVRTAEPNVTKTFGFGELVVIEYAWEILPELCQKTITQKFPQLSGFNTFVFYGHLSTILVSEGQTVEAGQLIAKSGKTGNVDGPHLHVELRVPRGTQTYLSADAQHIDPGILFDIPVP